jgi:hypothetical protein
MNSETTYVQINSNNELEFKEGAAEDLADFCHRAFTLAAIYKPESEKEANLQKECIFLFSIAYGFLIAKTLFNIQLDSDDIRKILESCRLATIALMELVGNELPDSPSFH